MIDEILNVQLDYKRLGCVACPYGSHIEQEDVNHKKIRMNRFEILYEKYPNLYKAQVINNGMYKILIDMGIQIKKDKKYMQLYKQRYNQINRWYQNFEENFIDVITQIENNDNYKGYDTSRKKFKKSNWKYNDDEIITFLLNYGILENKNDIKFKKFKKLVDKYRDIRKKEMEKYE